MLFILSLISAFQLISYILQETEGQPNFPSASHFFADHLLDMFEEEFCLRGTPYLRSTISLTLQRHVARKSEQASSIPATLIQSFSKMLSRPLPFSSTGYLKSVFDSIVSLTGGVTTQQSGGHSHIEIGSTFVLAITDLITSLTPKLTSYLSFLEEGEKEMNTLFEFASLSFCCFALLARLAATQVSDTTNKPCHIGSRCRGCLVSPIVGVRYRCVSKV